MRTSPVEVHLATDIVDLANGSPDDLVARIRGVREQMALSLGLVIPQVRTRDNVELAPGSYRILIAGTTAAQGQAPARRLLALGGDLAALPGTPTREAVFGLDGKWIPEEMRTTAEMAGSAVFDRTTVVTTQLASVLERHAARLLSRADVQTMLDAVAADSPETVEDVVPALVPASTVHQVLQGLLAEGVPINDLPRILETIAQRATTSKVVEHLVEACRLTLAPVIAERAAMDGVLTAITLDPVFEQGLLEGLRTGPRARRSPAPSRSSTGSPTGCAPPSPPAWPRGSSRCWCAGSPCAPTWPASSTPGPWTWPCCPTRRPPPSRPCR